MFVYWCHCEDTINPLLFREAVCGLVLFAPGSKKDGFDLSIYKIHKIIFSPGPEEGT